MVRKINNSSGTKRAKRMVKGNTNAVRKKRTEPTVGMREMCHIPRGYNIDTIVIMPVNRDTSFIYWEVTDRRLAGNLRKLQKGSARLMVKISESGCPEEICSFEAQGQIGNSYVNYRPSLKPLIAEIGISNGGGFVCLIRSGTVSSSCVPSASEREKHSRGITGGAGYGPVKSRHLVTGPSLAGPRRWMSKTGDVSHEIRELSGGRSVMSQQIIKYYYETAGRYSDMSSAELHGFFG